jgi:hypothetical protein
MTAWGYVKTKLEIERIVENCGQPWTILRLTQFYNYCYQFMAEELPQSHRGQDPAPQVKGA